MAVAPGVLVLPLIGVGECKPLVESPRLEGELILGDCVTSAMFICRHSLVDALQIVESESCRERRVWRPYTRDTVSQSGEEMLQ